MSEHNGDDLVSQGYGAKREVPRKQSEEAKQRYVVQCSDRYEEIMQQYYGFVCTNIYPRTRQVVEVSDRTVPSE